MAVTTASATVPSNYLAGNEWQAAAVSDDAPPKLHGAVESRSPAATSDATATSQQAVVAAPGGRQKRIFKVIVIGDANVGKTCLSFRFCNGRFPDSTSSTIGVDFRERTVTIDSDLIRVQLWDTAGMETHRNTMAAHYYRNVNAVVLVYDVTKERSFSSVPAWLAECARFGIEPAVLPMILVGNKCDLAPAVATATAQRLADTRDMPLFETSAKADSHADHVESIFMTLVHKLRHAKPMHVQSADERAARRQLDQAAPVADAPVAACSAC